MTAVAISSNGCNIKNVSNSSSNNINNSNSICFLKNEFELIFYVSFGWVQILNEKIANSCETSMLVFFSFYTFWLMLVDEFDFKQFGFFTNSNEFARVIPFKIINYFVKMILAVGCW